MTNISGIVKLARKIIRRDIGTGSDEFRILQRSWMQFLSRKPNHHQSEQRRATDISGVNRIL